MKWPSVFSWRPRSGRIDAVRIVLPGTKTYQATESIEKPRTKSYFPKTVEALQRGTAEHFLHAGTFYEAMGPVLAMAQCFGVMPVVGVQRKNASQLEFTWISARTAYAVVMFVLTLMFTVLTIANALGNPLSFDGIVPVIFYVSVLYIRFSFGRLARNWPELMQHWERVENALPAYNTQAERQRLAYRIKMLSITVLTLSLSEHLLNIISIVFHSMRCNPHQTDPIKDYFMAEQSQFFRFFEYRQELAFVGKLINGSATFLWTYMDLFVILMSQGLSERFRQINESLRRHKGTAVPERFWREHRVYYRNMCNLCATVDDAVSQITMVSFANNLYFVCVQLLRSLKPMPSVAHAVYFWFSLTFLITRTLAVSLYAADINDESKKPTRVLRAVPRESWCLEVKRFSDEVTYDVVGLSGMKFFHITRKLVLSVAGTIVTYELVLIQFNEADKSPRPVCG